MKRVFLTGASAGIGRAIADALVEHGHEVWGTSRDAARIPVREGLHAVQLDLRDDASIERAFSQTSGIDVLINNAGSGHFNLAESLPAEILVEQFRVLVFAQIRLMQLALAAMRGRAGLIINVSSLASRLPVPYMAAYNSAKAALAMFTMTTQLELGDSRIHIVDLQPGDIRTDFNERVARSGREDDPRLTKTWRAVEHNMKNAPPPDLVAQRVLRLIADENPPPRVTVGDAFQAGVAPLIFRFLPQRLRLWGLKKYYGI